MKAIERAGKRMWGRMCVGGIGAGMLLAGCGDGSEAPKRKVEMAQGVHVVKVRLENITDELEAPGTVIAISTAQVAARMTGTVLQVAVREGDAVTRGQLLARLDEREMASRESAAQAASQGATAGVMQSANAVAVAQAQADVMGKTYNRYVYLKEQKSVSPQEFDEVASREEAAQANLEQAKARLREAEAGVAQRQSEVHLAESVSSYARVVAPFDGRVIRRMVEPGSLVLPGMALFVIEDTSRYQLEVTLPTASLGAIKKNTPARVQLEGMTEKSLVGRVSEIEAGADAASHTLKARVDLPKERDMQSGIFGRAYFARGEKAALEIANEAAITRGQLRGIYVVDDAGLIHWRVVTLGKIVGSRTEVLSGLSDGEAIVLNPGSQELDGKKAAIASNERGETPVTRGLAGRIAHAFIDSPLTPLVIAAALLLGLFSIWQTPREEEPQIVVPMLDVFVSMPGASAQEVEQRVTIPMERLLQEIPGVEYLYSTSQPGGALVIVRYYVGIKEEDAIVRTYNKMYSNFDRIPPGASPPLIRARSIDDVPVLAMTLWGKNYDAAAVRRIAAEAQQSIKQVENVAEITLVGGQKRELKITLDPQKLAAFHTSPLVVARAVEGGNQRAQAGSFANKNQEYVVEAGSFLRSAEEARKIVVAVQETRPTYLGDVATITDGPEDPTEYSYFGTGGAVGGAGGQVPGRDDSGGKEKRGERDECIARRAGENGIALRGYVVPNDLQVTVTRNYGQTAKRKSDELLKHLFLATISVTLLVGLALGWRESGVVLLAIPVTLALTLFIFYAYGYTLNRVTLFALIFSIGILVDDAIVVVENIVRHFRLPENQGRSRSDVAVEAVDEVGNPTILATFAVIAAILPMAFVRGLMGPYMRPIPVGASAAMLFSLMVAFVVSPWAALRLLRSHTGKHAKGETEGGTTKLYRKLMSELIQKARKRWAFLGTVVVLLLLACSLVAFKAVRVKMLPFDNKSEFQVIVDMPEGTPLERTLAVEQEIGNYLHTQGEVVNYQMYAGTSGPYNFNGLVRHYYLRKGAHQGDIQVNLRSVDERKRQSHDLAKVMRGPIQEIARKWNARVKVAEVPPGPPVVSTLVAEVYGPDYGRQIEVARQIRTIFRRDTPGVVDVDWYVAADQKKLDFQVQQDKAALRGISAADVTQTVAMAVGGTQVGLLHQPSEREDVPVRVQLSRESRSERGGIARFVSGFSGWSDGAAG